MPLWIYSPRGGLKVSSGGPWEGAEDALRTWVLGLSPLSVWA